MLSEITAEVTIQGSEIVDLKLIGEETPTLGGKVLEEMPAKIIEAQSTDVDGMTGATVTTNAVKEAVTEALTKAGLVETEGAGSAAGTVLKLKETDITISRQGAYVTLELENGLSVKDVIWSTSDSQIATVYNGKVTAVDKGVCVIRAEYEGQVVECVVCCEF